MEACYKNSKKAESNDKIAQSPRKQFPKSYFAQSIVTISRNPSENNSSIIFSRAQCFLNGGYVYHPENRSLVTCWTLGMSQMPRKENVSKLVHPTDGTLKQLAVGRTRRIPCKYGSLRFKSLMPCVFCAVMCSLRSFSCSLNTAEGTPSPKCKSLLRMQRQVPP